ncbi:MAG TPA: peptide deformylase [Polyangiaceae bacterium]|jgi:peptide deformylase
MADGFDLDAWLASAPSPAPIVQAGSMGLRRRSLEVGPEAFGTPSFDRLIDIMVETMRAAPGVGLAAPQIGVPLRVFVAEDPAERLAQVSEESKEERSRTVLPLHVFVNPELTLVSGSEATFYEGCLSVRGYAALVSRATAVDIRGTDARGRPASLRLEGWPARIMQHETDHLDGVLYVDRMITRSFASEGAFADLGAMSVEDVLRELGVS